MKSRQFFGRGAVVGGMGVLCVVVSGVGVATAVNGGSLMLGKANTATHTTTLKDTKGTALSLISKRSSPPLKVNSKALVKNLNASELGGLTASKLSTGSGAQLKVDLFAAHPKGILLAQPTGTFPKSKYFPEVIASTANLAAGTYQVTSSTLAANVLCWLGTSPAMGTQQYGLVDTPGSTVALSEILTVKGQQIRLYCAGTDTNSGDPGGVVFDGDITAIKLLTASKGTVHSAKDPVTLTRKP
jgi:hypothetical protein